MPKRRILVDNKGDKIVIRDGDLRWQNLTELRPPQDRMSDEPPSPPVCCCAEPIQDYLHNAASDLESVFDKIYGAANKSTNADGYLVWTNAAGCPASPALLKVPGQSLLDDMRDDVNNRCHLDSNPPALFEVFNTMRDAIEFLETLIIDGRKSLRSLNTDGSPGKCEPPIRKFNPQFTHHKDCDAAEPCVPVVTKSAGVRVQYCQALCEHHYAEVETIVDEMLTHGKFVFDALVRPRTPCVGTTEGDVCLERQVITYVPNTIDCDTCGDCCMGPAADIENFYEEALVGDIFDPVLNDCDDLNCDDYEADCPPPFNSPFRDNIVSSQMRFYGSTTWTQTGASTKRTNGVACWFEVPVRIVRTTYNRCIPGVRCCTEGDSNSSCFSQETENTFISVIRGNPGFCTNTANGCWVVPSEIPVGRCLDGRDCVEIEDVDCTDGTITELCEYCSGGGSQATVCWRYTTFDFDADRLSCDASCSDVACPGTEDTNNTTSEEKDYLLAPPSETKTRDQFGEGTDDTFRVKYSIKLPDCPDSGLTGVSMIDNRINVTPSAVWQDDILEVSADDPDCPGSTQVVGDPLCLVGIGSLA